MVGGEARDTTETCVCVCVCVLGVCTRETQGRETGRQSVANDYRIADSQRRGLSLENDSDLCYVIKSYDGPPRNCFRSIFANVIGYNEYVIMLACTNVGIFNMTLHRSHR